jgi:hypothetical protein
MSAPVLRDVAYVAARLCISEQGVYDLVFHKRIAVVRLGSGRGGRRGHAPLRFLDEDIDAFITSRREPAADRKPDAAAAAPPSPVRRVGRRAARVLELPGSDRYAGGRRVAGVER